MLSNHGCSLVGDAHLDEKEDDRRDLSSRVYPKSSATTLQPFLHMLEFSVDNIDVTG